MTFEITYDLYCVLYILQNLFGATQQVNMVQRGGNVFLNSNVSLSFDMLAKCCCCVQMKVLLVILVVCQIVCLWQLL